MKVVRAQTYSMYTCSNAVMKAQPAIDWGLSQVSLTGGQILPPPPDISETNDIKMFMTSHSKVTVPKLQSIPEMFMHGQV